MTQIVTNIIQNSLSGMMTGLVSGAVTTVGTYAGDAVSGVGNMIEAKGQAVGNGIAKKFEGYGSGFTAYGNSVRNATAPNSGYYSTSTTQKKPVTAAKKTGTTAKKPSTAGPKKSLASIPERKLLEAPPTKSKQEKGPTQGTYSKSVEPYKRAGQANKSTYAASNAAVSTTTNKTSKPQNGKNGNAKLNQAQKNLSPIKSATNSAGKVVIDKKSLPSKTPKAPSTVGKTSYNGPLNLGGLSGPGDKKSKDESKPSGAPQQPKGGYQGPLNLGGITGSSGPKSTINGGKNESKPAPSKPASVAGGNGKPGGYAGPLNLGSIG